jgi:hypothetical protein
MFSSDFGWDMEIFHHQRLRGLMGFFLWHIIISWDLNEAKKWNTTEIFLIHLSQELFHPAWPIAMVCHGASITAVPTSEIMYPAVNEHRPCQIGVERLVSPKHW